MTATSGSKSSRTFGFSIGDEKHTLNSFQILTRCHTVFEIKIQEALLIEKLNPKLNKQLYAKGAFFCLVFSKLPNFLLRHNTIKLVFILI